MKLGVDLLDTQPNRPNVGFADTCVIEVIEGKSFTTGEVAERLGVSQRDVQRKFCGAPGVLRTGKRLLIPHSALAAKIRSMLIL